MASSLVIIQILFYIKYDLFISRYLAPPFLASLGAVGYVGYAFAQTKAVPSSPNVSFLHLLGVAGKHLFFFYFIYFSKIYFRWIWHQFLDNCCTW
jgi:hypothetical protein